MVEEKDMPMTREKIIAAYPGMLISLYKNEQGEIGFFGVTPSLNGRSMDMPVSWFYANGKALGNFHIFGDGETNDKTMTVITDLTKKFPVFESIFAGKK